MPGECIHLGQHAFINKLISRFNQFNNPELSPKQIWLYWYNLMLSFLLDDWLNRLKMKTKEQLVIWLIIR
uniref:Uncharacterized protein n=1 Tax=Arsenophonus nasoniae TaxID=638 RepID=D2TZT9_9GAMM|nr:conserved hypothetical protein [Arsenophonus nasoniae]